MTERFLWRTDKDKLTGLTIHAAAKLVNIHANKFRYRLMDTHLVEIKRKIYPRLKIDNNIHFDTSSLIGKSIHKICEILDARQLLFMNKVKKLETITVETILTDELHDLFDNILWDLYELKIRKKRYDNNILNSGKRLFTSPKKLKPNMENYFKLIYIRTKS